VAGPNVFETKVLKGLRACLDLSFPKTCKCGVVYPTLEDFVAKTDTLAAGQSLMDYKDRNNKRTIVGLYRNCRCHSTLMAVCDDRRDTSSRGIERREKFEELLKVLEEQGIERVVGRQELLKMLRGEESQLLEQHGIRQEKFQEKLPR
jgi:hypothetical protein